MATKQTSHIKEYVRWDENKIQVRTLLWSGDAVTMTPDESVGIKQTMILQEKLHYTCSLFGTVMDFKKASVSVRREVSHNSMLSLASALNSFG
jgi:hypothetical protein